MRLRIYSVAALAAAIITLLLLPEPARERLNAPLRDVFAPFFSGWRGLGTLLPDPDRESELLLLREQVARLNGELRQVQSLDRENRELRGLLGLRQRTPGTPQAARIIARNVNTWWQIIRIDRGASHNVTSGLPVITAEGLAGRVTSTSARTSDVLLLIDPGCRVAGFISRLNAYGIVQGRGAALREPALCRMDFIAREMSVMPGDEVLTSGLGGVFPRGLLIGYVRNVRPDPSGLYQSAEVLPAVDFRNLQHVFVLMNAVTPGVERGE
ncbi:MAG: rod shape-determining protein MreC [Kiritimatiellia bacterium]|nr:rod shape-determining protein MreC [Lentisphaerota bacterium]